MTTPRSPHEDDDFRQLTGAFDRPIAPSPRFAKEMKARISREMSAAAAINTSRTPPVSQRTARVSSAKPMARRRWVDVAIAAALIVAMLGGSFWYADTSTSDDEPGVPEATRYAAQPLASEPAIREPSTTSTKNTVARGGPLGSTSDRSLVNPDLSVPAEPQVLAWSQEVSDPVWAMAYGDVVATLGTSEIAVRDATTGAVLWLKSTSEAFRNATYDIERNPSLLLAQRQGRSIALPWIEGDTIYWSTTTELVGANLHTGDETFRVIHTVPEEDADLSRLYFPLDMAVRDGVAYVLTMPSPGFYVLHAIDLQRGRSLWSHEAGEPVGDWSLATVNLSQLVVTERFVAMQVSNDQNSILALDRADGSVVWQRPNALVGTGSIASSHLSAVDDTYLVLTHRDRAIDTPTNTPDEGQLLGVALYNIEDGYLLSTAREGTGDWIYPDMGKATCSLFWGWHSSDIYIPCTTDERVYLFQSPGYGHVTLAGQWETPTQVIPAMYDSQAVYLASTGALFRIDYMAREMAAIPLTGGEACNAGLPLRSPTVLCWNDDLLGTYTLQAFRPEPAVTPVASPVDGESVTLPGAPGNTNAYSDAIDLSRTYTAEPFGDAELGANEMLVVGDDLVFVGGPLTDPENLSIANPALMSRDIATGDPNWTYNRLGAPVILQNLATDGEHVYALLFSAAQAYPDAPVTYRLVALDGETGDVRWETAPLHEVAGVETSQDVRPSQPVVVNGTVLVAYGPDVLLALDSEGGELQWSRDAPAPAAPWDAELEPPTPSVVANGSSAFWSLPNGDVQQVDINTGEVVLTLPDPDKDGRNTRTTLHLSGEVLVVRRGYAVPDVPDVPEKTRIDVYAAGTGEGRWTVTADMYMGDITMTDDVLVIPGSRSIEPSLLERFLPFLQRSYYNEIEILSFDLKSGESLDLFSEENDYTNFPDFSAAGDTVCLAANTMRCVDREGNEMTVEGYEVGGYMSFVPPVYWEGQIIIGNGMGPLTVAKPEP